MDHERNYPAGSFAVTYHYVRQFCPDLPFFTYLDIENFTPAAGQGAIGIELNNQDEYYSHNLFLFFVSAQLA